uniref:Uncharacterized protein n=1 Tax=Anopheles maculatus TaxID=74869 RepID=A0A182SNL1_9DIPT
MASANFLEEALKSDVDESAVNAIVGTLENQLDANTNQVQQVDGGAGPLTVVGSAGGTTQTAVLNMNNNRVTLTPSSLPNGTLTMSQQGQLIQTNVVATGGGTKTIAGTTIQQQQGAGQPGQQQSGATPQTIIIKNSAGGGTVVNTGTPGIMTVSKPMNNQRITYDT